MRVRDVMPCLHQFAVQLLVCLVARLLKRASESLSSKWVKSYSEIMGWVRTRMSFAILSSSILCLRGSRTKCSNNGCYYHQNCHFLNNFCKDVAGIGSHLAFSSSPIISLNPTDTRPGKTKSDVDVIHKLQLFLEKYFLNK